MTSGWIEVGEDVWYRRYEPWDVNVGVVRGADGLCVVDTRGSHPQARQLLDDLDELGPRVVAAINTHWHFDHTWGNAGFAGAGAELWGHISLPTTMRRWFDDVRESLVFADPSLEDELADLTCTPPDVLVDPVAVVDLGDRGVEVRYLGAGHTDGDVIAVPTSANVVFAGDLVEQAGPPAYGDDSHPLAWPDTAADLLERVGNDTTVVPGHGTAVDRTFCDEQRGALETVATLFRELHSSGVPLRDALQEGRGRWPVAEERLDEAVLRAYEVLGRP